MLWVPNSLQRNWESQLPSDTQGSLAQSRYKKGGLFEGDKTMRQAAPNEGRTGVGVVGVVGGRELDTNVMVCNVF